MKKKAHRRQDEKLQGLFSLGMDLLYLRNAWRQKYTRTQNQWRKCHHSARPRQLPSLVLSVTWLSWKRAFAYRKCVYVQHDTQFRVPLYHHSRLHTLLKRAAGRQDFNYRLAEWWITEALTTQKKIPFLPLLDFLFFLFCVWAKKQDV